MGKKKNVEKSKTTSFSSKGNTAVSREKRLVALAMDVAEEQIRNRTASSQVLTHFLRLGSQLAELELEKLRQGNRLLETKNEVLQSAKKIEDLYAEAIQAFRGYRVQTSPKENLQDDG